MTLADTPEPPATMRDSWLAMKVSFQFKLSKDKICSKKAWFLGFWYLCERFSCWNSTTGRAICQCGIPLANPGGDPHLWTYSECDLLEQSLGVATWHGLFLCAWRFPSVAAIWLILSLLLVSYYYIVVTASQSWSWCQNLVNEIRLCCFVKICMNKTMKKHMNVYTHGHQIRLSRCYPICGNANNVSGRV